MDNLTLDDFWIDFMPAYQHSIGAVTIVLSAVATYLMIRKTPESGRPLTRYLLLIQASVLLCDFAWCFLVSPIMIFPIPGAFCGGLLCGSELGAHIGVVLLFQCMSLVAMTVACTLHYKYTVIARMTACRNVTTIETFLVRILYAIILELPIVGMFISGASQQNLRVLLMEEKQSTLLIMLDAYHLNGVAYSISRYPWIPILHASLVTISIIFISAATFFFVGQTLRMLSSKVTSMSERTRKIQRGLTNTLLLQLGLPFFLQIGPLSLYVTSISQLWFGPGAMNVVLCIQLCHAIFHTIFLLLTTPSYRNALMCSSDRRKDSVIVQQRHSLNLAFSKR